MSSNKSHLPNYRDGDPVRRIYEAPPLVHKRETEIQRSFEAGESFLNEAFASEVRAGKEGCYGLAEKVARFLYENTSSASRTLETGSGISTLIFGLKQTKHIAVTPNQRETEVLRQYAAQNDISLANTTFVAEASEVYLPRCTVDTLDLVLIDGKHAFPWPILDWFYTADRLTKGGVIIVDDIHLRPVAMLVDFLNADSGRWRRQKSPSANTAIFYKCVDSVHDTAWHMQPFNLPSFKERLKQRIRRGIF
ncbi:MAG: class I SAM-dependent methyltransferase [Acidobacteriia bacterium]|nr:class I SAM-dependent methyltransferase [Terriglobia bacterium]